VACRCSAAQPDDEQGELFLEINPSSTPEVTWRYIALTKEAQEAYNAFISNPENGEVTYAK
jgi:hypothetical protein